MAHKGDDDWLLTGSADGLGRAARTVIQAHADALAPDAAMTERIRQRVLVLTPPPTLSFSNFMDALGIAWASRWLMPAFVMVLAMTLGLVILRGKQATDPAAWELVAEKGLGSVTLVVANVAEAQAALQTALAQDRIEAQVEDLGTCQRTRFVLGEKHDAHPALDAWGAKHALSIPAQGAVEVMIFPAP